MHVVTVEFEVELGEFDRFLPLMEENAHLSLELEPGCRQFDVCLDAGRPGAVFLYEVYDSRSAFEEHLASDHFKRFDAATRDTVVHKVVRELARCWPIGSLPSLSD